MSYANVCMNGQFGWVPYTNYFKRLGDNDKLPSHVFNYEEINTQICGLGFDYDFYFTDETLGSLATKFNSISRSSVCRERFKLKFGKKCLKYVSFWSLVDFMNASDVIVILDISEIKLSKMNGCPKNFSQAQI